MRPTIINIGNAEKSLDEFMTPALSVVLVGGEDFGFRGRDEANATRLGTQREAPELDNQGSRVELNKHRNLRSI